MKKRIPPLTVRIAAVPRALIEDDTNDNRVYHFRSARCGVLLIVFVAGLSLIISLVAIILACSKAELPPTKNSQS